MVASESAIQSVLEQYDQRAQPTPEATPLANDGYYGFKNNGAAIVESNSCKKIKECQSATGSWVADIGRLG